MMRLEDLKNGNKRSIARALSALDRSDLSEVQAVLLDEAFHAPIGQVIGLTGPPGVGKSTLTQSLIERIRAEGRSVAVLAIDPSSQRTGGALLGDRTRLSLNPEDQGTFVRSVAARDRLGGLSDHAIAATLLLRALFDVVLVETVGVGQSDADITLLADRTLLCVQPGSGDALQFMKAGIMEWPNVICVTKADTGAAARRAKADAEGAVGLSVRICDEPSVHLVSALTGEGIDGLMEALCGDKQVGRSKQAETLLRDAVARRFGSHGLENINLPDCLARSRGPFSAFLVANRILTQKQ